MKNQITCQRCSNTFDVEAQPLIEIVNGDLTSAVVVAHPFKFKCNQCSAVYRMGVSHVGQLQVGWMMEDEKSSIIMPSGITIPN